MDSPKRDEASSSASVRATESGPEAGPAEVPGAARPVTLWFRVLMANGALGPGKIALLRLIAQQGSVSGAARQLGMSHAKSVKLVAELNSLFAAPLIQTRAGGDDGGGAMLTADGRALLATYAAMEQAVQGAAAPFLSRLAGVTTDA